MEATATRPSPPSWISSRMTILPKSVQCPAVVTVTSPVTQTEVVAVNSAVKKPVSLPGTVANGSSNSAVPTAINSKNPIGMIRAGVRNGFLLEERSAIRSV